MPEPTPKPADPQPGSQPKKDKPITIPKCDRCGLLVTQCQCEHNRLQK